MSHVGVDDQVVADGWAQAQCPQTAFVVVDALEVVAHDLAEDALPRAKLGELRQLLAAFRIAVGVQQLGAVGVQRP